LLPQVRLPVEDRRNPEKSYEITTFGQLHEKSTFDYREYVLRSIVRSYGFNPTIQPSNPMMIKTMDHAVKAIEIFNRTSTRTLANYIGWRVVSHFRPVSSEQFRQFKFEFDQVINGVKRMEERKQACLRRTYYHLNMALSRLFVEEHLSIAQKEKQEA